VSQVVQRWSAKERALNAICPYFTMFPLDFPLSLLSEHASAGDQVFDPFCGRGTTLFAARLLGLPSVGIDSHPVAVAVAQAKLVDVAPAEIVAEARAILADASSRVDLPEGDFWTWAFHSDVLRSLCQLRAALASDCASPARMALRATLLGCLHGPRQQGAPSYLSNQAPRTYAPKPRYATDYWRRHDLRPAAVDVLSVIAKRANRAYAAAPPPVAGYVVHGDSRDATVYAALPHAYQPRWVVTSPPYYGLRTYGPDQWLRTWLLGGPDRPNYHQPDQLSHAGIQAFQADLRSVWQRVGAISAPAAQLIVRFGGINDRKVDPLTVLAGSFVNSGWRVRHVSPAGAANHGRRQAVHFTHSPAPLDEHDVWAERVGQYA
jgi:hypothetical protein